jgi:hypothetical protein
VTLTFLARYPDDSVQKVTWPTDAQLRRRLEMAIEQGDGYAADLCRRMLGVRGVSVPVPLDVPASEPPLTPARAPEHKARKTDPATAKAAAAAIAPHITPQQARLLDAFKATPEGLTAAAASEAADVFYPSASTRITELEGKGLLVRTGETRSTPNGRQADVLTLAPSALAAAGQTVAAA